MIKKRFSFILCFASLLALVPSLHAQAVYTATRSSHAQVGAGVTYISPDYTDTSIKGLSFWGDYDFTKWVGVEVDVHIGSIITPSDIAESSYLLGPRITYHKRKFTGYGKLTVGRATITNQFYSVSSSYNAYAFGAGLEYKAARHINIRAFDFEMQKWPDFEPHTLSPLVITIGASYVIR